MLHFKNSIWQLVQSRVTTRWWLCWWLGSEYYLCSSSCGDDNSHCMGSEYYLYWEGFVDCYSYCLSSELLSVLTEFCGCLLTLCELWILSVHIELWWWSLPLCGFWIFICTQRDLLMVTHILWTLNIMCTLRALLMLWAEYFL